MVKNSMIDAEKLRAMSETEWFEFRNKSWLRKREYYNREMPETYLRDKEQFAQYIEKSGKRKKAK